MANTIQQAIRNEKNLTVTFSGYGHWKIECDYRGQRIHCTTTNSIAVDDFKSDIEEKRKGRNRRLMGYEDLYNEIVRKHLSDN